MSQAQQGRTESALPDWQSLATKADVAELRTRLEYMATKEDLAELRGEFAGLRAEFAGSAGEPADGWLVRRAGGRAAGGPSAERPVLPAALAGLMRMRPHPQPALLRGKGGPAFLRCKGSGFPCSGKELGQAVGGSSRLMADMTRRRALTATATPSGRRTWRDYPVRHTNPPLAQLTSGILRHAGLYVAAVAKARQTRNEYVRPNKAAMP